MQLRRPTLTASLWRRRVSAALSLGARMRPFDATHVLALFFPVVGMLPAIVCAISAYYVEGMTYRYGNETEPYMRFTPNALYPEPFAGLSNIAYITAGIALFIMPLLSGSFLAPHAVGAGVLFAFLGAGSWAFHKDASRMGTWEHAIDRIGMFSTFSYLGVVVFGGAFHSFTGRAVTPRSRCAFITNLACMCGTVISITYQDRLESKSFLSLFGTIVVAANGLTASMLAWRNSEAPSLPPPVKSAAPLRRTWQMRCGSFVFGGNLRANRVCQFALSRRTVLALVEGGVETAICCLLLFIGLALNSTAADYREAAAHNASLPDATRIEFRARHDMLHGTWHCLAAMAMLAMAMTMHRGLCSMTLQDGTATQAVLHDATDTPTAWRTLVHVEDQVAKFLCGALAVLMWTLRDAEPTVMLAAWAGVAGLVVPIGALMLRNITRRVDARWEDKRRALGATKIDNKLWGTMTAMTQTMAGKGYKARGARRTAPPARALREDAYGRDMDEKATVQSV